MALTVFSGPSELISTFQLDGKLHPLYFRATVFPRFQREFLNGQGPPAEFFNLFDFLVIHGSRGPGPVDGLSHFRGKDEFPGIFRSRFSSIGPIFAIRRRFGQMPALDFPGVGRKMKGRGQPGQIFLPSVFPDENFPSRRRRRKNKREAGAKRPAEFFSRVNAPGYFLIKARV